MFAAGQAWVSPELGPREWRGPPLRPLFTPTTSRAGRIPPPPPLRPHLAAWAGLGLGGGRSRSWPFLGVSLLLAPDLLAGARLVAEAAEGGPEATSGSACAATMTGR